MNNFVLLAVPLFIFMGITLEKSGIAEKLLETMALMFGRIKGGLAISVILRTCTPQHCFCNCLIKNEFLVNKTFRFTGSTKTVYLMKRGD